jgi:hypothetical protein
MQETHIQVHGLEILTQTKDYIMNPQPSIFLQQQTGTGMFQVQQMHHLELLVLDFTQEVM